MLRIPTQVISTVAAALVVSCACSTAAIAQTSVKDSLFRLRHATEPRGLPHEGWRAPAIVTSVPIRKPSTEADLLRQREATNLVTKSLESLISVALGALGVATKPGLASEGTSVRYDIGMFWGAEADPEAAKDLDGLLEQTEPFTTIRPYELLTAKECKAVGLQFFDGRNTLVISMVGKPMSDAHAACVAPAVLAALGIRSEASAEDWRRVATLQAGVFQFERRFSELLRAALVEFRKTGVFDTDGKLTARIRALR